MKSNGLMVPTGALGIQVRRKNAPHVLTKQELEFAASPLALPPGEARDWRAQNWPRVKKHYRRVTTARYLGIPTFFGQLYIKVIRASGEEIDYGLASLRVVTDTGVAYIVDAFQTSTSVELENMKFHGIGTGTTGELATQTALVTELTTEYIVNSTRATGTTTEAAANIYQTVATNTVDASVALREHGVFSQAGVPGGVMIDRSLFNAVNLENGDSIQTDYRLTFASGG